MVPERHILLVLLNVEVEPTVLPIRQWPPILLELDLAVLYKILPIRQLGMKVVGFPLPLL
jgi:hypothetical protein